MSASIRLSSFAEPRLVNVKLLVITVEDARFVVRVHELVLDLGFMYVTGTPVAVCPSLEEARAAVASYGPYRARAEREPEDNANVVEGWGDPSTVARLKRGRVQFGGVATPALGRRAGETVKEDGR